MHQKTQETLRVLIIDSCSQTRQLIKEQLLHENPEIWEASDGNEGLEIYKKVLPHLIVSETHLPYMDGYQLAKSICQTRYFNLEELPFLVAFAEIGDIMSFERAWSIRSGFNAHVHKGTGGFDELRTVINNFLEEYVQK
jgi:CheY-like chemotaxis protein